MSWYPRLLYLNRAKDATITSSAETTGYPDDNAVDWRDWLRWAAADTNTYWIKANYGSQVTATALGLSGHNIYTNGARYKLDGSNNDADWTPIVAYITPDTDFTRVDFFTEVTYQYFRLTIDNNGGASFDLELGLFFVGNYIEFPEVPDFPADPDQQKDHSTRQRGESGRLLGIVNDWTERATTWTINYLTQAWVSNTWLPYWTSYRFEPFIWVWDSVDHGTESYLMEWNMETMNIPYNQVWRMPLTLEMRGVKEE